MNKLIKTFRDIFSIEDLRERILNTLLFLAVYRLGSYIVLPGVDGARFQGSTEGIFGLLDTLLGGAFSNASIFGLSIMPYISASIVLQLLTVAVPYFQKLQKEGESGRKKINQYTRVLTIVICVFQSAAYISSNIPAEYIYPEFAVNFAGISLFSLSSIVVLTAGTIFCMWMGEKITDRGIGNGISLLIMVGIISRFPGAIIKEAMTRDINGALIFILELFVLFFVVMAVVMITQAVRQIPIQYAKQIVGNKVYGGQRQYLPIKVNSAGVMPIIFAQSLMLIPAFFTNMIASSGNDFLVRIGYAFSDYTSWQYSLMFGLLIIIFTFFYTAIAINPNQIADDMKRNNGFIPGVKPGPQTSDHIATVIDRITLPGAIFLALIAIMPSIASRFGVSRDFAQFFGGTSLLIMVGVILDTLQQVESYLLMKHYEGLMKTGKFNESAENAVVAG
ncbi:MAG TPA: preprotein translocase subunit SecY [Catalimonadaceae bacterium]|nr:preprotein translocase subunit SecY [Catalimonadaceae bacterium]